jgi:hypothetical protein
MADLGVQRCDVQRRERLHVAGRRRFDSLFRSQPDVERLCGRHRFRWFVRRVEDVTISSLVGDCTATWVAGGQGPRPCRSERRGPAFSTCPYTANAFTGDVEVAQGVLKLGGKGQLKRLPVVRLEICRQGKRSPFTTKANFTFLTATASANFAPNFNYTMAVSNGTVRFANSSVNAFPRSNSTIPYSCTQSAQKWGVGRHPLWMGTMGFSVSRHLRRTQRSNGQCQPE